MKSGKSGKSLYITETDSLQTYFQQRGKTAGNMYVLPNSAILQYVRIINNNWNSKDSFWQARRRVNESYVGNLNTSACRSGKFMWILDHVSLRLRWQCQVWKEDTKPTSIFKISGWLKCSILGAETSRFDIELVSFVDNTTFSLQFISI